MILVSISCKGRYIVPTQYRTIIKLSDSGYVPVLKDTNVFYGGSQMWFPENSWFSRNYVIHNYGCGTIAAADLLLYLAIKNSSYRNPLTESVLQGIDSAYYIDYMNYVHAIDHSYTRTKRWLAVLGPQLASAINSYANNYALKVRAKWKFSLSYYDMLEAMEEMLSYDIPAILSIGPNTPKLWGKKGIPFYRQYTKENRNISDCSESNMVLPIEYYTYQPVQHNINSHYITVTGIYKDPITPSIMLSISSWGKQYYVNYEEYREYINDYSGTLTSSIIYIKKK